MPRSFSRSCVASALLAFFWACGNDGSATATAGDDGGIGDDGSDRGGNDASGGGDGAIATGDSSATRDAAPGPFTISGTVVGLDPNDRLTLTNNGTDTVVVPLGGAAFTFPHGLASGSPYDVTIADPIAPVAQRCRVLGSSPTPASGAVANASVSGIVVTCGELTSVCGTTSGSVGWTASIAPTSSSLALLDIVAGPTNDVIVADKSGGATLEQHRWDAKGVVVSQHQDHAGLYTGTIFTSNLLVNAQNELFYGVMLTGLVQGANSNAALTFTKLAPDGTVVFADTSNATMPTSSGAPSVPVFDTGFDSGGGLHGSVAMSAPKYFQAGVYCYGANGTNEGVSATTAGAMLGPSDSLWPAANGLYLAKPLTASTNLGCGNLSVPAAGAMVIAKLDGNGACTWNKLLALPTAVVTQSRFRLGADGSLVLAIVYSGTIDFGGGALVSAGTSSLAIARFDAVGNLVFGKSFGGTGSHFTLGSVGVSSTGVAFVTSGYGGTVDLGGGVLPSNADTLVAAFTTTGQLKWSRTVTVGAQGSLVATAGSCAVFVATNSTSVDFGTGPLSTTQGSMPASIGVAALGL